MTLGEHWMEPPSPWKKEQTAKLPFAEFIHELDNQDQGEPIQPAWSMKISVDRRQPAFREGGLPVDQANAVSAYANEENELAGYAAEVETVDLHDKRNLSLAENYDPEGKSLPAFSQLILKNGQVWWVSPGGQESAPYDQKMTKLHGSAYKSQVREVRAQQIANQNLPAAEQQPVLPPSETIEKYLQLKRNFRVFAALVTGGTLRGLEQTLWPDHASSPEEELAHVRDPWQRADFTVVKGGEAKANLQRINRDDRTWEPGWKPDSYSGIFNAIGGVVDTYTPDGRTFSKQNVGHKIREMVAEQGLTTIVLEGIAYTHCVLDTAEGLKVMQGMSKVQRLGGIEKLRATFNALTGQSSSREKFHAGIDGENNQTQLETARAAEQYENFSPELKAALEGVNWQDMVNLYNHYESNDMFLDEDIRVAVLVDQTAPVQLGFLPYEANESLVNEATQAYQKMGVDLVTARSIKPKW